MKSDSPEPIEIKQHVFSCLQEGARLHLDMADRCADAIASAAGAIASSFASGGKLLICGNGGSAADSQHIAAEFIGRLSKERDPLPAVALTTDTSVVTAVGNDYGFEMVFARQVLALGKEGDVLMAISTSGRSPNVLAAVKAGNEKRLTTVGLSGGSGGPLGRLVEILISPASADVQRIQECHISAAHIICELVEAILLKQL